jgi:hypothetical protein
MAAVPPAVFAVVGLALVVGWPLGEAPLWMRLIGAILMFVGVATVASLVWRARQPRLAYANGHLLVWLRGAEPLRVPLEYVECFWLGQTLAMLPGRHDENAEVAAVVIRVADSAGEWRQQEVSPELGTWCEGYITIRGTWCEPLSIELVNRLNQRLSQVNTRAQTGKS